MNYIIHLNAGQLVALLSVIDAKAHGINADVEKKALFEGLATDIRRQMTVQDTK